MCFAWYSWALLTHYCVTAIYDFLNKGQTFLLKASLSLHFEALGWRAKERSLPGVQQDWFAWTTRSCAQGNCCQSVLASSSTILLIWFVSLYGSTQRRIYSLSWFILSKWRAWSALHSIFWRSFKTKKNLLSFSKDKVFNSWLSKVQFFITPEGFYLCVFAIIYLPVSCTMRISKPATVGLDCCVWCEENWASHALGNVPPL